MRGVNKSEHYDKGYDEGNRYCQCALCTNDRLKMKPLDTMIKAHDFLFCGFECVGRFGKLNKLI